jgi:hypothetical protein
MQPDIERIRTNAMPDHVPPDGRGAIGHQGLSRDGTVSDRQPAGQGELRLVAKPFTRKGSVQIAEVANGLIDPILARRAGINTLLLGSWDEIAGEQFAGCSRPERIRWPTQDGPRRDRRRFYAGHADNRLRGRAGLVPDAPAD